MTETMTLAPVRRTSLGLSRRGGLVAVVAGLLIGVIAALIVYQIARVQLESLFDARLADHGVHLNDEVVALEREHLALVRAIAFTEGFTAALERHDAPAMQSLVTLLQANSEVPMVDIVDETGTVILAVRGEGAPAPLASRANWSVVQKVLAGERDEYGERDAALVIATEGPLIVTAGPVAKGSGLIGAVVVSTPVTDLLAGVGRYTSLTVYNGDGAPIVTNLDDEPSPISPEQTIHIVEGSEPAAIRSGIIGSTTYREMLGRLVVRRLGAAVLGVARPDNIGQMAFLIASAAWLALAAAVIVAVILARLLDKVRFSHE